MITVLLSGGLGNQMFQYAAGKALAARLETSLSLDLFYYFRKTQATRRQFGLDVFAADLNFVTGWRSKVFVKYRPFFLKHRCFSDFLGIFSDIHALLYESEFERLNDHVVLAGYFQNEAYFKSVEADIRNDFRFRAALTGRNADIASQMDDSSVSLHVRRGDYVSDPTCSLAVCDAEYYYNAIELIAGEIPDPCFFVFSDDSEWVTQNIDFKKHRYVLLDWNTGSDSYIDIQLMSMCRHNIIANSSFSWWGAWLNNNPQKTVIAPKLWFKDNRQYETGNRNIPDEWVKI
jgi:hypothetical protein